MNKIEQLGRLTVAGIVLFAVVSFVSVTIAAEKPKSVTSNPPSTRGTQSSSGQQNKPVGGQVPPAGVAPSGQTMKAKTFSMEVPTKVYGVVMEQIRAKVTLKSLPDNAPLVDATIKVREEYSEYYRHTDNMGVAWAGLSFMKPGSYKMTVSYGGESKTVNIIVDKAPTSIPSSLCRYEDLNGIKNNMLCAESKTPHKIDSISPGSTISVSGSVRMLGAGGQFIPFTAQLESYYPQMKIVFKVNGKPVQQAKTAHFDFNVPVWTVPNLNTEKSLKVEAVFEGDDSFKASSAYWVMNINKSSSADDASGKDPKKTPPVSSAKPPVETTQVVPSSNISPQIGKKHVEIEIANGQKHVQFAYGNVEKAVPVQIRATGDRAPVGRAELAYYVKGTPFEGTMTADDKGYAKVYIPGDAAVFLSANYEFELIVKFTGKSSSNEYAAGQDSIKFFIYDTPPPAAHGHYGPR